MTNIKEIAKLAGVSTATVSRVINQHAYVSEEARQRVTTIIEQLDYVPNASATSLKKGHTRVIGLVAVSYNTLLLSFVRSFSVIAQHHEFHIMLFITNNDPDKEKEALEMLRSKKLDALVCLIRTNEWSVIEPYTKYGPIVTWQRLTSEFIPSVFMDHYQGYMLGLEFLYRKGYRRILNVFSSKGLNTRERIRAYEDFRNKYQLPPTPFHDFHDKMTIFDGEEIASWWMNQRVRPDAVFCPTDDTAAGLLTSLKRAGFSIPGDIGIMGFDNMDTAHLLDLTTIHYPVDQQAEHAFYIIMDMLEGKEIKRRTLQFTLIERCSV